jgi:hypothetical protein
MTICLDDRAAIVTAEKPDGDCALKLRFGAAAGFLYERNS